MIRKLTRRTTLGTLSPLSVLLCCPSIIIIVMLSLYYRWICFCHVPVFCESLQKFETTHVFGRILLSSVFLVLRRQLMDRFTTEQDKMVPEKRNLILNHFPRYITMMS